MVRKWGFVMQTDEKIKSLKSIIRLGKYVKGMSGYMLLSVFFNMLFKLIPILISFATSYMISLSLFDGTKKLFVVFFVVLGLVILSAIASYMDILVSHDMAYRILAKMRNSLYEKIDELAPAGLEDRHSGDLTNIVLEDVEQLEWFYAHTIEQWIVAVLLPVTALILMGKLCVYIPLSIIPFILALLVIPPAVSRRDNRRGFDVKKAYSTVNARIVDGVQGMKDVLSYNVEKDFKKKYRDVLIAHRDAQLRYAKGSGQETRLITLLIGIGSLAGDITACNTVVRGELSGEWLLPVFMLSMAIFAPIQEAMSMSVNYGMIFGAAGRILELFDRKKCVENPEKPVNITGADKGVTLSIRDIHFRYPESRNKLLQGVSIDIAPGEALALVGESGSGKSTIAGLIQRFRDVDDGQICLNGIPIVNMDQKYLRSLVTQVPQDVFLFNTTVLENIRLGRTGASDDEVKAAAKEAMADEFISNLPNGYETVVGEKGLRLSGGEKQRISIARALLKNSPVLILDEASASLDAETERQVNLALTKLKKSKTTMVIAHRLSTIRSSDKIAVLHNGKIEAVGQYDELLRECDYFAKLVGNTA